MRPILATLPGWLLILAIVAGAEAQTHRAIKRPGSPEAPEVKPPRPTQPDLLQEEPQPPSRLPSMLPSPLPATKYSIGLGARQACVTPQHRGLARAEGGFIDVSEAHGALTVSMTGTTAANAYLGCTGMASESFQLVQEFEITSTDPSAHQVVLKLDSALTGFVRSKGRASARVRLADISVTPCDWVGPALTLAHPPMTVSGTQGQLCNQHLPPCEGVPMPLGRFTLVANLTLDVSASGLCDAHAVADFSPDTKLPADWVRTRDPFQGVAKAPFGFRSTLTATPPPGGSPFAGTLRIQR
ncbi:MAG: hypothetical protein ABI353_14930 [Isosphaeraceae bacterium]